MRPKILSVIGTIEILIGCLTLIATTISIVFLSNTKTPNVLAFVIISASTSALLGAGILILKKIARNLLVYFSSIVLISKILICADIIRLNGALETFVPDPIKSGISIAYHSFVIIYLSSPEIKKLFGK